MRGYHVLYNLLRDLYNLAKGGTKRFYKSVY